MLEALGYLSLAGMAGIYLLAWRIDTLVRRRKSAADKGD